MQRFVGVKLTTIPQKGVTHNTQKFVIPVIRMLQPL